jgi:hypothetical protein
VLDVLQGIRMSKRLWSIFEKAIDFPREHHGGNWRKSSNP